MYPRICMELFPACSRKLSKILLGGVPITKRPIILQRGLKFVSEANDAICEEEMTLRINQDYSSSQISAWKKQWNIISKRIVLLSQINFELWKQDVYIISIIYRLWKIFPWWNLFSFISLRKNIASFWFFFHLNDFDWILIRTDWRFRK